MFFHGQGLIDFSAGFGTVGGMKRSRIEAGILAGAALACLVLWGTGCSRNPDGRDARDRNLRRAQAARDAQDLDGAVRWYEKALARRPDSARAHRELGLLYDNFKRDYVPAIYHYERYLELRPEAADRADVEGQIAHCRTAFAAEIAAAPAELKRALGVRDERIRALELEVATLRPPAGPGPVPAVSAAPPAAAPAAPAAQVHVVQAGESLGAISTRYYGTPTKWQAIFNANRSRVPDANNLKVGTRLDIPPP